MQTCIMSSLPRCIFRCSVFRYVTLVSFFLFFLFKLCYLIVTLLLWWRINTYLLTYCFLWACDTWQVFRGGVSVVWCLCRWLAGVSLGSSAEGGGGVYGYGKDPTLLAYNANIIHCLVYKESTYIIHQSSFKKLGLALSC